MFLKGDFMKTKKLYKYSKNPHKMDIKIQKYLSALFSKGEIVYFITKDGIIKDIIDHIEISENSVHIVGYLHTDVAKNIGYTIFKDNSDVLTRVEEASYYINKHNKGFIEQD